MTAPAHALDTFDETVAQAMADALLNDCASLKAVNDDDQLVDLLRSLNHDYELGWTCRLIGTHMDEARRLFIAEMERIEEEAEFDGVMEPHPYASERFV